jgi:hypothetical protein
MYSEHYGEQIQYPIKLQAKILQNDPWVRKKDYKESSSGNLSANGASTGATRGEACLASFFFVLLVPLI